LPTPWSVEELAETFCVRDANGQALGYFYFDDDRYRRAVNKRLTRHEARGIAANVAKLAGAVAEGVGHLAALRQSLKCLSAHHWSVGSTLASCQKSDSLSAVLERTASLSPVTAPPRRRWLRDRLYSRLQQEGSAVMADHHPHYVFLTELDYRDPDFSRKCLLWMGQTQREILELVASSKMTLSQSRTVMDEADLLLARR
jgi:hypothetical protein